MGEREVREGAGDGMYIFVNFFRFGSWAVWVHCCWCLCLLAWAGGLGVYGCFSFVGLGADGMHFAIYPLFGNLESERWMGAWWLEWWWGYVMHESVMTALTY